jgi:hypothetical protein
MNVQQCLINNSASAGRATDRWQPLLRSPCTTDMQMPCAQPDCCRLRQTQRLRGAAAAGAGSCLDRAVTRQPAGRTAMRHVPTALAGADASAGGATATASAAASAPAAAAAPGPSGMAPALAAGRSPAKLAVFVSGGGSNLKALHAATQDGRINGRIVVSDGHYCMCLRSASAGTKPSQRHAVKHE